MTDVEVRRAAAAPSGLTRVVAFIATIRAWALKLGLAAALAAALIVYALVRDGYPGGGQAVLVTLGIAAAAFPPVMLTAFWVALGELGKLPDRIRNLPYEGREHGERLRDVLDAARANRGRRLALGRSLWQITRIAASARETLTPYAPLLPFLSVPFLIGVAVAMAAAVVEILIACIVAIVLAVS